MVSQSGTEAAPITLNGYGSGSAPTITGGKSGNCIRINGNFATVDGLRGVSCGYAGISVTGDHNTVRNSSAANNAVGIKAGTGSDFGKYTANVLTNNNIMNVLTQGTNCGTPQAVNCSDDSGASGVLINGNDNELSGNTVSGSTAFSYDYTRDGGSFEIYNGNRNYIHHNVSLDNNNFSEIGRSTGTADGNTYRYNLVRSTCGANCAQAKGLIARGPGTSFGPTNGTVFEFNTVYLNGPQSQAVVCHASCPASTVIRGNILAGVKNSLWINGSGWTERQNVFNGPINVVPNSTSTTAPARFVNAPADLHLTSTSPAIDRAGASPAAFDLAGVAVPQDGDCSGASAADSGAYEFDPPNC
ncbi:hemolysin [Arthrobacter sp. NicSoilB8]|nr:hemolysin [Arthrobacter sp. NicSoilB8]